MTENMTVLRAWDMAKEKLGDLPADARLVLDVLVERAVETGLLCAECRRNGCDGKLSLEAVLNDEAFCSDTCRDLVARGKKEREQETEALLREPWKINPDLQRIVALFQEHEYTVARTGFEDPTEPGAGPPGRGCLYIVSKPSELFDDAEAAYDILEKAGVHIGTCGIKDVAFIEASYDPSDHTCLVTVHDIHDNMLPDKPRPRRKKRR